MIYAISASEDLQSGLLKEQFLRPAEALGENFDVKIINFCRPFLVSGKRHIIDYYLLPPARYLFLSWMIILIMPYVSLFCYLLDRQVAHEKPIFWARGYFAALICARWIKTRKRGKLIFDPRSLFIDELIYSGSIKRGSLIYKKWREYERCILAASDAVICVSHAQGEFYRKWVRENCLMPIIPCFSFPLQGKVTRTKKEFGVSENEILIGYFGSMNNGWNNTDHYLEIFERNPQYKFLIVSQDNKVNKSRFMSLENVIALDTDGKQIDDLRHALACCDYGIVSMPKVEDWETRLSVKFVDYLTLDLKVIVGQYVGEAVRYCQNFFQDRSVVLEGKLLPEDLNTRAPPKTTRAVEMFGTKRLVGLFTELAED